MANRVMVKVTAWILAHNPSYTAIVESYWVDATTAGSASTLADVSALDAASPNHYAVSQWHVWYEDGGHSKHNTREFKALEMTLGAVQPEKAPVPLVPTPEA